MFRLIKPALVAAALGSLALAPTTLAGQPTTADLNPPPPSFYTCMATGDAAIGAAGATGLLHLAGGTAGIATRRGGRRYSRPFRATSDIGSR
jgi:hypothetical protein